MAVIARLTGSLITFALIVEFLQFIDKTPLLPRARFALELFMAVVIGIGVAAIFHLLRIEGF